MIALFSLQVIAEVDPHPDVDQGLKDYWVKLWDGVQLRNDGAVRVGTTFRPLAETVRDTAESLIAICGVEPRMKAAL